MDKNKLAEQILHRLESQRFADWYQPGGRFDTYITVEYPKGNPQHVSKDDILQDIKSLFGLD